MTNREAKEIESERDKEFAKGYDQAVDEILSWLASECGAGETVRDVYPKIKRIWKGRP